VPPIPGVVPRGSQSHPPEPNAQPAIKLLSEGPGALSSGDVATGGMEVGNIVENGAGEEEESV
ncbi:hypothetical protein PIB30_099068, partial [Stylosanthes scabra]|nr:hypothetical protein [Stylosanthes scabra]